MKPLCEQVEQHIQLPAGRLYRYFAVNDDVAIEKRQLHPDLIVLDLSMPDQPHWDGNGRSYHANEPAFFQPGVI